MAVVELDTPLTHTEEEAIDWEPLVNFAWDNTEVGDIVTGVLTLKPGWDPEVIAIRLKDNVVAVTSKPISTSLIPDGGLWRTGTYAGCHIGIYYKEQEEHDYVSMTVYSNLIKHYVVCMNGTPDINMLAELGNVLRQYALDHWFKDHEFSIRKMKKKNPGINKQSYRKAV
jgi:hypothetical protein